MHPEIFQKAAQPEGMGTEVPREVQGKSPGRGSEDEVLQKLTQNVKLVYNFKRFLKENLGFSE